MEPTAALETDHAPPDGVLLREFAAPIHAAREPVIAVGVVVTVTIETVEHPVFAV
jgi:hypothetical protein